MSGISEIVEGLSKVSYRLRNAYGRWLSKVVGARVKDADAVAGLLACATDANKLEALHRMLLHEPTFQTQRLLIDYKIVSQDRAEHLLPCGVNVEALDEDYYSGWYSLRWHGGNQKTIAELIREGHRFIAYRVPASLIESEDRSEDAIERKNAELKRHCDKMREKQEADEAERAKHPVGIGWREATREEALSVDGAEFGNNHPRWGIEQWLRIHIESPPVDDPDYVYRVPVKEDAE